MQGNGGKIGLCVVKMELCVVKMGLCVVKMELCVVKMGLCVVIMGLCVVKMGLCVVKILADGVRRAMNYDVLCVCTFNAIWQIPANIEVFRNFCKYFIRCRRHMLCL
jgi:hypothetical protein